MRGALVAMRAALAALLLLPGVAAAQTVTGGAGGAITSLTNQKCITWDSTTAVTAQTIEFPVEWATYTITGMKSAVSGGGSFSVAVKINGTNVTSLSAVSVSGTSNTVTAATGANTGVVNDQVSVVVSSPSGTINQAYVCPVFTHSVN